MRIGGRDNDGFARPISTDFYGKINISNNVEVYRVKGAVVPGGIRSTVIQPTSIVGFSKVYVMARTEDDLKHDFEIWGCFLADFSDQGTTFGQQITEFEMIDKFEESYRGATDQVDAKGALIRLAIWNRSEEDKTYDIYLMGVL